MLGQNFNAAMHRVGQQMPFHNPALLLAYSNHSGSHVACTCHDDSVTIFGINDAGAKGVGSQKILRRYRWMSRVQKKWQSHTQPSYENGLCGLIKQAKGPKSKSLNAFKSISVLSNACSDVIARAGRSLLNGEVAIISPKSRGST